MKKTSIIIITLVSTLIGIILILFLFSFTGLVSVNNIKSATSEYNLEATYLTGSEEIVTEMKVSANIEKNQSFHFKTLLKEMNNFNIIDNLEGSKITFTVENKNGEILFRKNIYKDETITFPATEGEGTVKVDLSYGQHDFIIKVNNIEADS